MPNSKDKHQNDLSRIAEARHIFSRVNGVEFRDNYQGFDFVGDNDNFINKEQINVHMNIFDDNPQHYELTQNYLANNSDKQFNILFINDGINANIMYISDVEALTGFKMKANEKFGESSQVTATLIPYAIASTVKLTSGIHSFYYDIRTEYFLDSWLEYVFQEAKQVKKDNKYMDETTLQYYDVPVIGFNSAKFDASILFKNLKSKDAMRDFGNRQYKKGRFPHEFINTNNYMNELNKCEPFPIEAFDSKLRNKQFSEDKYKDYLVEAASHKSRLDFLKHYNILDTGVLVELIDYLIELMFKYKVDILANISMSQCSNAIKYSMKSRDPSNSVIINDYDYFKELFKNQRCHICNARFTWKNRPTLDRIDNSKGHSKDNVIPCCLYSNVCKANRDEKQMKLMVQLKKYSLFKQSPMTSTCNEGCQLLRKGITGSISNVMYRYNIEGET
ncbi:MAG: hypothetical protein EZS28_016626 [Streblomastix strix]|uniref:Uncharacterized protein n=1 Tax=Streblomastix strix TaxID=222440 RepID=A0A5J4VYY0_9EUKA|nr:MAG: hypothetical protein EZS28_016626 [Streblomastix strix]